MYQYETNERYHKTVGSFHLTHDQSTLAFVNVKASFVYFQQKYMQNWQNKLKNKVHPLICSFECDVCAWCQFYSPYFDLRREYKGSSFSRVWLIHKGALRPDVLFLLTLTPSCKAALRPFSFSLSLLAQTDVMLMGMQC